MKSVPEKTFATAKPGELYRAPDGCMKRKPMAVVPPAPTAAPQKPVERPQNPKPGIPKADSLRAPQRGQKPAARTPSQALLFKLTASLREQYPAIAGCLPLRIGVLKDLVDGGLNQPMAMKFIKQWTNRREYLSAVAAGTVRFNLDGTQSGQILLEKHKAFAAEQLEKQS